MSPAGPDTTLSPVPLTADHDTSQFVCRHESLNHWLVKRAVPNAAAGASRTYVVCAAERRVVGYYALSAGSIDAYIPLVDFGISGSRPKALI